MAVVRPFRAVRPKKEFASKVAALPYDVMNSDEARCLTKDDPLSFLHIDKAEIDLPPGTDLYADEVYLKAKENLRALTGNGICVQDAKPMLYVYRQELGGRAQTGIAACVSVDDYLSNKIKKHEFTRADKEADRIRHVDVCDANTGPIFLTYRARADIDTLIAQYTENEPEYAFSRDDGTRHTVWLIDNEREIAALCGYFEQVDAFYIADGHHRAASAVRVGQMRRSRFPDYTGEEEFNFFLAVLFKSDELKIMDYNRVLKDWNGLTKEELLERLGERFCVKKCNDTGCFRPGQKHQFGFYVENEWYQLTAKPEYIDESDPVARLDVSILQRNAIAPVFGIEDPRTDKRIDFVGGIRGLEELERRVATDMAAAFSMFPTTLEDLMAIADSNQVMPPKSTWFEPKLLSGLFIHKLSDDGPVAEA
ncbi:MAG: DUF1015 family protein [Oscillospiraceae bacterium]|jgi:uncharacterized protein (DUF1015 family)|nr:DUF1015 family protein [Oscillospiraceae bacterium]